MSQLNNRASSGYYKTAQAFRDDWMLMFNNARTYNLTLRGIGSSLVLVYLVHLLRSIVVEFSRRH